ncbi:hypothetical protein ERJ75_000711700 [Trypanosoma vivax]|nr:hypothetical protein ERJ75_000711700 [Trypanosoma vivax]
MRPVAATRGTSPLLPVLTLLCALGFAAPPHGDAAPVSGNITLSFTSNTLDVAALWLLNVVNKRNLAFSVPPQEMTGVKVGDMRVENITAGSLSLKMMSPNKISVVLQNVSANSRNASFKIDAPLIHRTGNFSISPREANFSFVVSVVDDVGKRLKVSLDDTKLELKDLGLKYWLDSVEKSTHRGDIIRTLLEKCAILIMQHNVPDVMKSVVEKNLNSGLATLPILLAGDPNVTSERAVLSFTVLGNETVNESSSAASDPLQPPLPDRDIAVVASFAALNNLMRLAVNRTNVSLTLPSPRRSTRRLSARCILRCTPCALIVRLHCLLR